MYVGVYVYVYIYWRIVSKANSVQLQFLIFNDKDTRQSEKVYVFNLFGFVTERVHF